MTRITTALWPGVLLALGLLAAPAQAQFSRTYVSAATGSDANSCGFGAPCRSFQRAHDQTNSDGEITVLDPGDYTDPNANANQGFGLTIRKSISIVNDGGGEASIQVSAGQVGIDIVAGPGAYINLRGITVQGVGGVNGLQFSGGFSLTITNCVFRNLNGIGILVFTNSSSNLSVSNTLVADNGSSGISITLGSGTTVKAVFSRVELYNNSLDGIALEGAGRTGTINATVVDSVAANNHGVGFNAETFGSGGTPRVSLTVVRSVSANNGTGLNAGGAATITLRVAQSVVTGNATSWSASGGAVLQSYADNKIDGNGDASPTPFLIVKK